MYHMKFKIANYIYFIRSLYRLKNLLIVELLKKSADEYCNYILKNMNFIILLIYCNSKKIYT